MADDKEERRGFQVKDRRRFSDSGEARPDVAEETAEPPPRPAAAESAAPGTAPADEPVTFSTFVLGLSTQALLHLGEIPNPMTRALERDLGAAKHVIDILGILQEKTRSNLEPGEESLLDSVLYDLRMRYVELVRGGIGRRQLLLVALHRAMREGLGGREHEHAGLLSRLGFGPDFRFPEWQKADSQPVQDQPCA